MQLYRPMGLTLLLITTLSCGGDDGPSLSGVDLIGPGQDLETGSDTSPLDVLATDDGSTVDPAGFDSGEGTLDPGPEAESGECLEDDDCIGFFRDLAPCEKAYCVFQTRSCKKGPTPDGADCDDGNPCTTDDACKDQVCLGTDNICGCESDKECQETFGDDDLCNGVLLCDKTHFPFTCEIDPDSIVVCPDEYAVPCLALVCVPETGLCESLPAYEGEPCEDGDPCTLEDDCHSGACEAGYPRDCSDGNLCTVEMCVPPSGDCVYEEVECDDGDACNGLEYCLPDSGCTADSPPDCDDGEACTQNGCHPDYGCYHTAVLCDDGNACTTDWCDDVTGQCINQPIDCDDGDLCTGIEYCDQALGCQAGIPKDCNDGNPCSKDTCVSSKGCIHTALDCGDGDACTVDSCNPGTGACSHVPKDCGDGNLCNGVETCQPNLGCQPGLALNCNDQNACTDDDCLPASGCSHQPVSCDDGIPCTVDTCDPNQGCVWGQKNCTDNDACTLDSCETATGNCLFTPRDCSDGDPCTYDACDPLTGCVNGPVICNDDDICTDDICDPASGTCLFPATDCDDGDPTSEDLCDPAFGGCYHVTKECDDQDKCTDDLLDPQSGCVYEPHCQDDDLCTTAACDPLTGDCSFQPLVCDDGDPCTDDTCAPGVGCTYTGNGLCCGDGKTDPGEACDDGNTVDWDGCTDCGITEFLVNAQTTGLQVRPDSAAHGDGRFVVVWDANPLAAGHDAFARTFTVDGDAAATEYQVNNDAFTDQELPRVAILAGGRFVVTWRDTVSLLPLANLNQRTFAADGSPEGAGMAVNANMAYELMEHAVGAFDDGGFLVAWDGCDTLTNPGTPGLRICARRYKADATPQGSEFVVTTAPACCAKHPSITTFGDSGSLVVWSEYSSAATGWGILGRRSTASGLDGDKFKLVVDTDVDYREPDVAALSDGGFVVAFTKRYGALLDDTENVLVQRFDKESNPVGSQVEVALAEPFYQGWAKASVDAFDDDRFVVAWHGSDSGTTGQDMIRVRLFKADGDPDGTSFAANIHTPGNQNLPRVSTFPVSATFPDGGFLVSWHSNGQDGDSFGIFGQRFHADGTRKYR